MRHSSTNTDTNSIVFEQNWRSAQDYHYTMTLSKEQWAWQFLRRNPEYQRDWHCFIDRWRALEQDYGVAPHRDFPQWKKDPRAYAAEYDTDAICVENDGVMDKINEDAILIECWMGAKWGFYKFPQNPVVFSPAIPEDLLWREQDINLDDISRQVRVSKSESENDNDNEKKKRENDNINIIAIHFDVNLPLKAQLLKAKQKLLRERRTLADKGLLKHQLCDYIVEWTLLLRYLDAIHMGESLACIEAALLTGNEKLLSMKDLARQAKNMLNRGYLALLMLH